jgi:hypothetical protein
VSFSGKIDLLARSMERHRPKEQQPVSLAEAAIHYAAQGWPVFPLAGKIPFRTLDGRDGHGYHDATTDPELITAWWQQHPTANIGLPTGEVSGVIVLDLDPRHADRRQPNLLRVLTERYGELPKTRTVRTAHGGLHCYFAHPKDGHRYPNAVQLDTLAGVDVRGDGGYVVLPPSKLHGRLAYTWGNSDVPIAQAPDWLLARLAEQRRKEEQAPQGSSSFAGSAREKWLAHALSQAAEGNRNRVGFQLACQLRDDGLSEAEAAEIMLAYAEHVPQGKSAYSVKEAFASLHSAYRRPPRERARRSKP